MSTETIEIEACQVGVGDRIMRERFGATRGTVRRLAQSSPGDPSVGFYLDQSGSPRWFDPEEIVLVERPSSIPSANPTQEER